MPRNYLLPNMHRNLINFSTLLAVRKPLRYETVQTKTRCQCWMCFTWISAAMLCCPALWTEQEPTFDKYAYICVPNWQHMAAYSTTLGSSNILILLFIKLLFFTFSRSCSGA